MSRAGYSIEAGHDPWKVLAATLLIAAVAFFFASNAAAAARYTAEVDGIEATFRVSPKMADLLLVDKATGRAVTVAAAELAVTHPDGSETRKKLVGMKMGKVYSYMNSIDLPADGVYTFTITVTAGTKTMDLSFKGGVR